jgi:hypothetical protein
MQFAVTLPEAFGMMWTRSVAMATLVGTIACAHAAAQGRSIRGGPVVGMTSATFGGEDSEDSESKVGLVFGGFLSFGIAGNVALETGAFYSQRGAKFTDQGITAKLKLNYIEVPAHLTVRFPGTGTIAPFIGAGPALGFKVGCSVSFSGGGASVSSDCNDIEDELGSDIKGIDFGLSGTAGVDIRNIRIALAYFLGLSSIDGAEEGANVKNRVFTLSVGYGFQLR